MRPTLLFVLAALVTPLTFATGLQAEDSRSAEPGAVRRAGELMRIRLARLEERREGEHFQPLRSSTLRSERSPRGITPPGFYDVAVQGDLELGRAMFSDGSALLHADGGKTAGNTALGLDALVSATVGYPLGSQRQDEHRRRALRPDQITLPAQTVCVNGDEQLGPCFASSRRFKEQILDMGELSSRLEALRRCCRSS